MKSRTRITSLSRAAFETAETKVFETSRRRRFALPTRKRRWLSRRGSAGPTAESAELGDRSPTAPQLLDELLDGLLLFLELVVLSLDGLAKGCHLVGEPVLVDRAGGLEP